MIPNTERRQLVQGLFDGQGGEGGAFGLGYSFRKVKWDNNPEPSYYASDNLSVVDGVAMLRCERPLAQWIYDFAKLGKSAIGTLEACQIAELFSELPVSEAA